MVRYAYFTVPAIMLATMPAACAVELDTLLPNGIPGFGTGPEITVLSRLQRGYQDPSVTLGGLTISPAIAAGTGFDSAPNASHGGSALLNIAPSLLLADKTIGLGAFAAWQSTAYPQNPAQNASTYTIALGEAAALPQNTITLAIAQLRSQQTGFALEPATTPAAATLTGTALRAGDELRAGMVILTPELSYLTATSSAAAGQTARQSGFGLKLQIIPDGVLHLIASTTATNLTFTAPGQNAWDYSCLFGLSDTAAGLWNVRLLAGLSARAPAIGKTTIIPVIEAEAAWMPDDLTSLSLTAAHEIDDPTRIDTASYTITEAKLSIDHEYLRNVILSASFALTHAAFFSAPLDETIIQTNAGIAWRLNATLKLSADYAFNDRQANRLRAANEHSLTLSLAWSP